MRAFTTRCTTICCLLALAIPIAAQSKLDKFPKPSRSNPLGMPSELQRKYWSAQAQRKDVVEHAIYVITEMSPNETAGGDYLESLNVIRQFRAAEGVEILSKRLLYQSDDSDPERTFDFYPASWALIHIGQPAIPAMLRIIRAPTRSELERRIACWVLLSIEANSDPDLKPDDDIVKSMVLQRISSLKHLGDAEKTSVESARVFIEHFVETEGHWRELPTILVSEGVRPVRFGNAVDHQFLIEKPLNHPDATIKFIHNERLEELGLKLSESGKLTGTPKTIGRHRLTIYAQATWKIPCGGTLTSVGAARFRLGVSEQ